MVDINRRNFLKLGAVVTAAAITGNVALKAGELREGGEDFSP